MLGYTYMTNEIQKHLTQLGIDKFIKDNELKLVVCLHANHMLWECSGGHLWNIQMIKDAANKSL
jgi:hypothetical protein